MCFSSAPTAAGGSLKPATFTARDYQETAIADARRLVVTHRRLLLVLPTGGGKTCIAALIIRGAIAKGRRVLFLAHRREIIAQSFWKIVDAGVPETSAGVVMANGRITDRTGAAYDARRPLAPVQVASVQTLVRRAQPQADLVFVDEAHHNTADSYQAIASAYLASGAKIVGLTATPCRGDGRGLGDAFDHLHVIAQTSGLIANGYLSEPRCWTLPSPDLKGVRVIKGDYDQAELDKRLNTTKLAADIVREYQRLGDGRTAVVFCVSVAHSKNVCTQFNAAGIPAEHLDAETPTDVRDAILRRLADGTTAVCCNMGVLTEGWDLPRAKYCAVVRPSKSLGLYLQMVGRVLRPWQGVAPIIADHGGCIKMHGLPQEDREWSLDGKEKVAPGAAPTKECPSCGCTVPAAARVCPNCGYEFPEKEIEAAQITELVRVEAEAAQAKLKTDSAILMLRKAVNSAVGKYARSLALANGTEFHAEIKSLNTAIVRHFKKRRPDMTDDELRAARQWIQDMPPPGLSGTIVVPPAPHERPAPNGGVPERKPVTALGDYETWTL